ncbi:MAG: CoA transferase [Acetobacteraceae bacterium]|nr:CoA transferase [Acetobacteraceae bacterium]
MADSVFAGLRVIDCASFVAAPAAATIMSDFGADVIKVEPPGAGDAYRNLGRLPGLPSSEHDWAWLLTGRNKRSLALDLKQAEARAALHRLVAQADVFITNYPLGVRRRLGIDHKALSVLNPRLIYASFTAYGEVGEEAEKTGFDSTAYWARSGLMDLVRADRDTLPARSVPGMGDHPSASSLYGAVVTALYRRERTGKGAYVSTSLLANGLWANGCFAQAKLCGATFFDRPPREASTNACTNMYRCRDGRWFILSVLNEERQFASLLDALNLGELLEDPRFATLEQRRGNARDLTAVFDKAFATRDLAEWRVRLDRAGITFGIVGTLDDMLQDRQMHEIGALVPFADADLLTVSSAFQIDGETKTAPRRGPDVGQHSADVLGEAGFSEPEVERLRAAGALG